MIEIQVGKRTFPVRFDLGAWMEIDERFGGLDQMEADKTVKARIACLAIFARAGARYCGGEAPTEEYLTKNLSPKGLAQANRQASRAFVAGMKREMAEDDDEDIDVVAEKLKKKKREPDCPALCVLRADCRRKLAGSRAHGAGFDYGFVFGAAGV